ncbi:uncharacterized protein LOC112959527 [Nothoprocta perdicaria]|uniref:uncharacterized protein LOC112959527 n=1 Tax=Nothoprocta perdicaria TaxID=30464 RepID=UPI000E1BCD3A|nr:uncharacterized protein LOC112959527 [Nothoprocta perdicaria]
MASLGRAGGDRKENVPPRLRRCSGGEQTNIQKNVNIDLFLSARSQVDISHHWHEPAAFSVDHNQRAGQSRLCTAPLPAGERNLRLIQTNLPCPSQTLRDTTSQLSNSCFQQQNNLCSRLQQHSSKDLAYSTPCLALSVLPAVDLPWRPSCLYADSLEGRRSESVCLPQQYHQRAKTGGCCSIHSNCHFSERRNKHSKYPVDKQQCWSLAASFMAHGNPSHLPSNTVDPLLGNKSVEHLSLSCCRESVNSFCCASALSLGDLRPSSLAESFPNSASLQSLLDSSQTSADLHCSIQRLKQEAVWMGLWGSLPLEPLRSPANSSLCFSHDDSAPGVLSSGEQLAGVSTHAAQARLKWNVPFAKDWNLGAVPSDFCCAEPASVSHRYRHTDSHMWRTKLSGNIQQETLSAAVGSGWLVDAEADSSCNCSPCFRYQAKSALETGRFYVHKRNHSSEKIFKREKKFDGTHPRAVFWKKDFPSSLYPEGLQVALEKQLEGAQVNGGVAIHGTPREMCMRVTSPSGDREFGSVEQLGIKYVEVSTSEPHGESSKELQEMCDTRLQATRRMTVVDSSKSSPFSKQAQTIFDEFPDIDSVNLNREGGKNKPSCQHRGRNWEPDTNVDQSGGPSVERSASKPQCWEEGSQMQETVSREVRVC